jgi:hypothetical protein
MNYWHIWFIRSVDKYIMVHCAKFQVGLMFCYESGIVLIVQELADGTGQHDQTPSGLVRQRSSVAVAPSPLACPDLSKLGPLNGAHREHRGCRKSIWCMRKKIGRRVRRCEGSLIDAYAAVRAGRRIAAIANLHLEPA